MDRSLSPHYLVLGALQAALTLFGGQMAASILLANGNGTALVDLWILSQALAYVVAASFVFIAYRPRFPQEQTTENS